MYHPPNSDIPTFLASYNSLVCAIKKERPKGIIIGLDHNLDFLKSDKHPTTNTKQSGLWSDTHNYLAHQNNKKHSHSD